MRRKLCSRLLGPLLVLTLLLLVPVVNGEAALRLITIVGVSDWHGQLDPLSLNIDGQPKWVGGAATLKYYFDEARRRNPQGTIVVTAGDAIGATPPISNFFADVPAIEAQNAMGFDIDTLGNHHFDNGLGRLRRLMDLARFHYVAANVSGLDGQMLAPPYHVFVKNGVKVGIIGIANPGTPEIVGARDVANYKFLDPAPIINRHARQLRDQGIDIIVVIAHIGARAVRQDGVPIGPLGELARQVRGVDVLIGDHTDVSVNAVVNKTLVIENRSQGAQYAVIDLEYDVSRKTVVQKSAILRWTYVEGARPDQKVQAMIDKYRDQLQPHLDRKIGETAVLLARARGESPLGNLVTDIMRKKYNVQLAFYNSGGLRADIPSGYQPADKALRRPAPSYTAGPPFDIVRGDFFAVEPFGNLAVTFKITGETLWQALENSVSRSPLQISGFKYVFDPRMPPGERVRSVNTADGTPIPRDSTEYSVVTIGFLYNGGDGYTMLNNGTGTTRELITDILSNAVKQMGAINVRVEGRIIRAGTSFNP